MKRYWFQADDGTYYRNCPLIMDERKEAEARYRFRLARKLADEWWQVFREGVIRKPRLERGDVLAHPASMRESYPGHPGLWLIDDWPSR